MNNIEESVEDKVRCEYCGDFFPENELTKNLDGGLMCDNCWNIARDENPEMVIPVFTVKDFDNRAIYFNPNAPRKNFYPLNYEEMYKVLA
jgi:hypothetical protein